MRFLPALHAKPRPAAREPRFSPPRDTPRASLPPLGGRRRKRGNGGKEQKLLTVWKEREEVGGAAASHQFVNKAKAQWRQIILFAGRAAEGPEHRPAGVCRTVRRSRRGTRLHARAIHDHTVGLVTHLPVSKVPLLPRTPSLLRLLCEGAYLVP